MSRESLTPSQREFARLIVTGEKQTPAYRKAYKKEEAKDGAVRSAASRLMKDVNVKAYIKELQAVNDTAAVATRQEILEFHTQVLRTAVGKINAESPLCQEVVVADDSVRVKMCSKEGAAKEICRMMGYYEPEDVNVHVTAASKILSKVAAEIVEPKEKDAG